MPSPFNKIGLAVTFSPNGFALLKESFRLKKLLNASMVLIHVGKKTDETEKALKELIKMAGMQAESLEIIWEEGDAASVILNNVKTAKLDLLIAGALEKENIFRYYVGSVARKLMRESESSVLILKNPSPEPEGFKKICVAADYSVKSETTLKKAHEFALLENASDFVIVKDYNIPALASTIVDSGSSDKLEVLKDSTQHEEEEKMKFFVKELNLKGIDMKMYCLYGKEGFESNNFARENKADLFVITAPQKRSRFIDKLFPHEQEFAFASLPSNLLIVR